MTTLIIYKSTTGFTETYAKWMQEETNGDLISFDKAKNISLKDYDTIIFASSLHAGKIKKIEWFKEQVKTLKDKKLCVLATGAMPALAQDKINEIFSDNLSEEERKYIRPFFVEAGLNYEKMGLFDKFLMWGLKKHIKKTEGMESPMYKTIEKSFNNSSKDNLKDLLNYVK